MRKRIPGVLALIAAVAVGFVAGRWTARRSTTLAHATETPRELMAATPASVPGKGVTVDRAGAVTRTPSDGKGSMDAHALLAIKKMGIYVGLNPFKQATGKPLQLSDAFIAMFGLSPDQTDRLNQALASAQEALAQLSHANSEGHLDASTGNWVVHTKPFPDEGGSVHDALFGAFSSTLGPDRMADMDALEPGLFDNILEGFGSQDRTMTLTRQTVAGSDVPVFKIVTTFKSPGTGASGSSTSQLLAEDVSKDFPLTKAFVPASFFE